jgi:hypothetical protein
LLNSYVRNWGTLRPETRFSKLIFIGKEINREELEENLYQLLSKTEKELTK